MNNKTFGFQWHLTDRCNLRCAHCYQDGQDPALELGLGLGQLKEAADRILGAIPDRLVTVDLTGGEPCLLGHLPELMAHLQGFLQVQEIGLITNGTLVTDRMVEVLGQCARLSVVKVSMESPDPDRNDSIRGSGAHAAMLGNLERLKSLGRPVVLMMTLGRHNLSCIAAMLRFAREMGVAGVIFERFVPLGQGRQMAASVLSAGDWAYVCRSMVQALERLDALGAEEGELDWEDLQLYRAFWVSTDPRCPNPVAGAQCNLGDESMALLPDGTVLPCRRLPVPVGNVLTEPFGLILERLAQFSPQAMRPRLGGERCARCGAVECSGCRALAYSLTGDPCGDDLLCSQEWDGTGTERE